MTPSDLVPSTAQSKPSNFDASPGPCFGAPEDTIEARKAHHVVDMVAQDDLEQARLGLLDLAATSRRLPRQWLLQSAEGLDKRNWDLLSEGFTTRRFAGNEGHFLIVAPSSVVRQTVRITRLTALFGRLVPFNAPPLSLFAEACQQRIGPLRENIGLVLPFYRFAGCGNAGTEETEAFIVPNSWQFRDSQLGPALNDMTEQRRRLREGGRTCIRRIWDADTADCLLDALDPEETGVQNWSLEYQCHDVGHAAGMGFHRKLAIDLFATYWYGGVEEWRADGVSLELAEAVLTPESRWTVFRVNLAVRLALDAHRGGGLDRDADVCAALLTLDRLLDSGAVQVRAGRLRLSDLSPGGYHRLTAAHRHDAISLTRAELDLQYPSGACRLFGAIKFSRSSEALLRGMVLEPCADVYRNLR
jgi:hypothetical protein